MLATRHFQLSCAQAKDILKLKVVVWPWHVDASQQEVHLESVFLKLEKDHKRDNQMLMEIAGAVHIL